jgi:hypothetical protein
LIKDDNFDIDPIRPASSNPYKGMLPPIVDPRKFKDDPKPEPLRAKPKNPKVQEVKEGRAFDRKRTFIKNWEYEDPQEEEKKYEEDD